MSVHWPILRTLTCHPLRTVIRDDQRDWKAAELLVAALHIAGHVEARCKTDTLGVLLPTSGLFPAAALAGWMLGKTIVPLNYLLSPEEIDWIVRHCGTDTVVSVGPILDHLGYEPRGAGTLRLDECSFSGMPEPRVPKGAKNDDLAALLYTSGTSGRPKGVELTHGNLKANIRQVREWISFQPDDKMLGALPQFHSFGFTILTLLPLTIGIPVVYIPRFVPTRVVKKIRDERPTFIVALPSMYSALQTVKSATAEDFSSLRYVVSGGEPLPEAVFQSYQERFNITINEGYGLTETAPATNWCRPHEFKRKSVGRALPDVEIAIADIESGRDLPAGASGEVRIGGPNVTRGYYKEPELTARMHDEKGRLRTGDIGHVDEDGHLYITGRHKEMLIIAGENVFPREIEEALNQHPSVLASGVVGVQDPLRGETAAAVVELVEGQALDADALRQWCREKLGAARTPRQIAEMPELPKGPTGKIQRRELSRMIDAGELALSN